MSLSPVSIKALVTASAAFRDLTPVAGGSYFRPPHDGDRLKRALEAALPILLADAADSARANNDHIVPGGDGYSAGFHYALHCIAPEEES